MSNPSKAVSLQANNSSSKADNVNNWLVNIRDMETTGGTLGLSEKLNKET